MWRKMKMKHFALLVSLMPYLLVEAKQVPKKFIFPFNEVSIKHTFSVSVSV